MSPLAHPRRPLVEPETAQLLRRPSALLAGRRGQKGQLQGEQRAGQRSFVLFSGARRPGLSGYSPRGLSCSAQRAPGQMLYGDHLSGAGGGSSWSQSYPGLPFVISASRTSSPRWCGVNQAVGQNPETQAEGPGQTASPLQASVSSSGKWGDRGAQRLSRLR